jgi:RNA polymerase sigma factor (sigma-70 family)
MRIAFVARLQHGDLVEALEDRGWTQAQGAQFLGLSLNRFHRLVNLKWIPKQFSPEFTVKLFELTGKTAEELFPDWARQQNFVSMPKKAKRMIEAGPHMLNGAGTFYIPAGPEEVFQQGREISEVVNLVLSRLDEREAEIVRRVVMEGETHEEVGQSLGISAPRVGQILRRTLSYLRQPLISYQLYGLIGAPR